MMSGKKPLIIAVSDTGSYKSNDSVTWTADGSIAGNAIAYNGSMWVVVGNNGSCATSPDGITWTSRLNATTTFSTRTMTGVAWSPTLSRWVATASAAIGVFYSADGITWTNVTPASTNAPQSVAWLPDLAMFVAGGVNWSATSTDGITWTNRSYGSGSANGLVWASGFGLAIAAGDNSKTTPNPATTAWTTRLAGGFYSKRGVAYSPTLNRAVMVGDSGGTSQAYSDDGTTWTSGTFAGGTRELKAVCWSPALGKFVTVGASGVAGSSSDGITWSNVSTGTTINFYGIATSA